VEALRGEDPIQISLSFLYNAIFFTHILLLSDFYEGSAPLALYLIAFAAGNLCGPLIIGHLFDTIGRETMIAGTYILSGVLLGINAFLFNTGLLTALSETICWCVIFFFASAGASAAYLTVSEIFPLEVRAKAIAVFFAIAEGFGALGPVIYGALIGDGTQPFKPPTLRRERDIGGELPDRMVVGVEFAGGEVPQLDGPPEGRARAPSSLKEPSGSNTA
jgi:MFS family permease